MLCALPGTLVSRCCDFVVVLFGAGSMGRLQGGLPNGGQILYTGLCNFLYSAPPLLIPPLIPATLAFLDIVGRQENQWMAYVH